MNVRRILLGAVGLFCLALGTVVRDVGTDVTGIFSGSGGDYVLMVAVAVVVLLAAVPVLVSGRESQLEQTETPDPEVPVDIPAAGSEFDETIRGWTYRTPVVGDKARKRVKERLRTAAVESLMRAENCDRNRARQLVRHGDWTDDTEATAFLGSPQQSVVATLGNALPKGKTPAQYRARRTADAIHAVDGGNDR